MMIEQNTNYAYKLKYLDNPSFDKVRDLAVKFYMELPKPLQEELYDELHRGVEILDSEPLMLAYLHAYGIMHQAKLNHAFNHLPEEYIKQPEINIIDYGCGQALGTMCYIDYLKSKNISQKIKSVTLIEPSELCLKRAALHASVFCPDAEILTINKSFDDLNGDDFSISNKNVTLHILSNVLDIRGFDLNEFFNLIYSVTLGYSMFVCVSPFIGKKERDNRISTFAWSFSFEDSFVNYVSEVLNRYELDINKPWTCQINVFKVDKKQCTIKEIKKLAERGSIKALYYLGLCYENGQDVLVDYDKAIGWYKKAAEQGYVNALYALGKIYCKKIGDKNEAFKWFQKSAELDNVEALTCLGCCYLFGHGVNKNYSEAFNLFLKSAQKDISLAQAYLGECYYSGYGVNIDYQKAFEWHEKAAKQGQGYSQYILGKCYYYGKGINIDYQKAFEWYEKSAKQDRADAQYMLGLCYYYGKGINQDHNKAIVWCTKAAEQGKSDAQFMLGDCYYNGDGIQQNKEKAIEWYTRAAKQGHKKAIEALKKEIIYEC